MTSAAEPVDGAQPGLVVSLVPLVCLIALLAFNVYVWGDAAVNGPHQIALLLAGGVGVVLSLLRGVKWLDVQHHIVRGISVAVPAILILLVVGALSGTWLVSGIVPAMIYYGLHVLSPGIFLFAACVICALVSLATGSSWSTAATVGIALVAIGTALGVEPAMVAGAVISGSYFGDKLSPLSDTTNLAAGVTDTELFTHIRYMMYTTTPSLSLALLLYLGIGFFGDAGGEAIDNQTMYTALDSTFDINPFLMLVPLAVLVMIVKRVPALPAITIGALLGAVFAFVFQPDVVATVAGPDTEAHLSQYVGIMQASFGDSAVATGNAAMDELLTSGGMAGMLPTVWLIFAAMVFGGTMESGGFLARITVALLARVRGDGSLIAAATGTCLVTNVTASDQYLAIAVPGRMFVKAFADRGLASQNLSRALEDAGTVTSVLVPWNTCGAYHAGVLGVATLAYAPFAFFCLLSPFMTMLFGFAGIRLARVPVTRGARVEAELVR